MTIRDLAAGQVMLCCPACGTTEATDRAVLAGSPRIVCRNCGETWPGAVRIAPKLSLGWHNSDETDSRETIEAEASPFTARPEGLAKAWAARIEADAPVRQRPAAFPYAGAVSGALLFVLVFVGGREAAVAALPDLSGLYAAVGMPVNLAGFAIEEVVAERSEDPLATRLVVRGAIRNISGANQDVPPLMAEILSAGGVQAAVQGFEPPVMKLAAGGSAPFVLRIDRPPSRALDVAVRFRRPAEAWPPAGDGAAFP